MVLLSTKRFGGLCQQRTSPNQVFRTNTNAGIIIISFHFTVQIIRKIYEYVAGKLTVSFDAPPMPDRGQTFNANAIKTVNRNSTLHSRCAAHAKSKNGVKIPKHLYINQRHESRICIQNRPNGYK